MKSISKIKIIVCFVLSISNYSKSQESSSSISFHAVELGGDKNIFQASVFSSSAKVYSKPDTNSIIIESLYFKNPLNLLEVGEDVKEIKTEIIDSFNVKHSLTTFKIQSWYKISLKSGIGFIKNSDVSTHTFGDEKGLCNYFFLQKNSCWIYKFDNTKNQFVDSLELKSFRNDYAKTVEVNSWKNVNILFRSTMTNAYCGGGITTVFVIDANGKLSELIRTESSFDDEIPDGHVSNLFLPIKFNQGKVLLILNGDIENVFNTFTGELNISKFPPKLIVPKNEFAVFNDTQIISQQDMNGELLLNTDGSYKTKTIEKTKYFKWNGFQLTEIKNY